MVWVLRENGYLRGEWSNPDEIAQSDFDGWNDPVSTAKAADKARDLRHAATFVNGRLHKVRLEEHDLPNWCANIIKRFRSTQSP